MLTVLSGYNFISIIASFFVVAKPKEYEAVAKEYMEANYAGNVDKAKTLCVPEAAPLF